jgi:uncharacterized damage-inducible protein DinB
MAVYNLNTRHTTIVQGFLADAADTLGGCRQRIEHCLKQLSDEQIWWRPQPAMNAIGNLILHLCGNLGQWIVAGVGGRPDTRQRQAEFDQREPIAKDDLLARLRKVIDEAIAAVGKQTESELLRVRPVQQWQTTGLTAIFHSVCHLEGHAQEIIYITRMLLGEKYQFLWEPKKN